MPKSDNVRQNQPSLESQSKSVPDSNRSTNDIQQQHSQFPPHLSSSTDFQYLKDYLENSISTNNKQSSACNSSTSSSSSLSASSLHSVKNTNCAIGNTVGEQQSALHESTNTEGGSGEIADQIEQYQSAESASISEGCCNEFPLSSGQSHQSQSHHHHHSISSMSGGHPEQHYTTTIHNSTSTTMTSCATMTDLRHRMFCSLVGQYLILHLADGCVLSGYLTLCVPDASSSPFYPKSWTEGLSQEFERSMLRPVVYVPMVKLGGCCVETSTTTTTTSSSSSSDPAAGDPLTDSTPTTVVMLTEVNGAESPIGSSTWTVVDSRKGKRKGKQQQQSVQHQSSGPLVLNNNTNNACEVQQHLLMDGSSLVENSATIKHPSSTLSTRVYEHGQTPQVCPILWLRNAGRICTPKHRSSERVPLLGVEWSSIVLIDADNVPLDPTSSVMAESKKRKEFLTDKEISKPRDQRYGRELTRWVPSSYSGGGAAGCSTSEAVAVNSALDWNEEELKKDTSWNQFANIKGLTPEESSAAMMDQSYYENIYSTSLDESRIPPHEKEKAERISQEIMEDQKRRLQKRGLLLLKHPHNEECDSDGAWSDEEARYGAVQGTGAVPFVESTAYTYGPNRTTTIVTDSDKRTTNTTARGPPPPIAPPNHHLTQQKNTSVSFKALQNVNALNLEPVAKNKTDGSGNGTESKSPVQSGAGGGVRMSSPTDLAASLAVIQERMKKSGHTVNSVSSEILKQLPPEKVMEAENLLNGLKCQSQTPAGVAYPKPTGGIKNDSTTQQHDSQPNGSLQVVTIPGSSPLTTNGGEQQQQQTSPPPPPPPPPGGGEMTSVVVPSLHQMPITSIHQRTTGAVLSGPFQFNPNASTFTPSHISGDARAAKPFSNNMASDKNSVAGGAPRSTSSSSGKPPVFRPLDERAAKFRPLLNSEYQGGMFIDDFLRHGMACLESVHVAEAPCEWNNRFNMSYRAIYQPSPPCSSPEDPNNNTVNDGTTSNLVVPPPPPQHSSTALSQQQPSGSGVVVAPQTAAAQTNNAGAPNNNNAGGGLAPLGCLPGGATPGSFHFPANPSMHPNRCVQGTPVDSHNPLPTAATVPGIAHPNLMCYGRPQPLVQFPPQSVQPPSAPPATIIAASPFLRNYNGPLTM